jgi:hypothetical protein
VRVGYLCEVVIDAELGARGNAVPDCCTILRGLARWQAVDPSCFEC